MKIAAFLGSVYASYLLAAFERAGLDDVCLSAFDGRDLGFLGERAKKAVTEADLVFVYDSGEGFEAALGATLTQRKKGAPYLRLGYESADRGGDVDPAILAKADEYLLEGGPLNGENFWRFLRALALGDPDSAPLPQKIPKIAFFHPNAPLSYYENIEDFLAWLLPYGREKGLGPAVGALANRFFFSVGGLSVENALVLALEKEGLLVLPVFAAWAEGESEEKALPLLLKAYNGSLGPKVVAIVKLMSHFSNEGADLAPAFPGDDSPARAHVRLFRELNVPVFQGLCSWGQSVADWAANPKGVASELSWTLAITEFEGAIEPFFLGGTVKDAGGSGLSRREPSPERVARYARRVKKWARLNATPPEARKVAFILHGSPCASVEGTVGAATGLDAAESVAQIAKAMKEAGYRIEPPESGALLIEEILAKKALSEFRWTAAQEIVGRGGALALISPEKYGSWFKDFPESAQNSLIATWGSPPGEILDDVPPAMVYKGQIVVPGLKLGENALVMVQPKRGCAGSRCDGRVCRILQDPLIPPPHQYLAVYRWLESVSWGFGAHVVVHVGTRGSLETLPGKSAGLSQGCFPDLAIFETPNLYVFASEAAGEGLVAKRRSYAALVSHLPALLAGVELSGPYLEASDLLAQRAKAESEAKKTAYEAELREKAPFLGIRGPLLTGDFSELEYEIRKAITLVAGSQAESGLHVFGKTLKGPEIARLLAMALRRESGEGLTLREWLAKEKGFSLSALSDQKARLETADEGLWPLSPEASLSALERETLAILTRVVGDDEDARLSPKALELALALEIERALGKPLKDRGPLSALAARIADFLGRLRASREIPALLDGLSGGYLTPGPSTALGRGRIDSLPTGRNFYAQDPRSLPTPAAVKIGWDLAERICQKHFSEEGRFPESVAFFWISSDLLRNEGEDLAQTLALMGLKPKFSGAGLLTGVETIPLVELKRPRIDLTIRISGIMRDCFTETVEILDRAIKTVAALDEPVEANYVRAHTLENLKNQKPGQDAKTAFKWASRRIFGAAPGACVSGVYLAVMASAWENSADLAELYLTFGSYAYGEESFGELAPAALKAALSRVDVSYVGLTGEGDDFLGCGGFFGAIGGLTRAAENIKGRAIRHYVGDSRDPKDLKTRTLTEEISRSAAARLLNPAFIAAQKKLGYRGAMEIANRVGGAYGWQATTKAVDPAIFDGVAKTYFLDPENREFFEKNNPYAFEEMGRRLLEAANRGLWEPDPSLLEDLKAAYLSLEGVLEERTETFGGEIQGGAVDILTVKDVASWREKMDEFKARAKAAEG